MAKEKKKKKTEKKNKLDDNQLNDNKSGRTRKFLTSVLNSKTKEKKQAAKSSNDVNPIDAHNRI